MSDDELNVTTEHVHRRPTKGDFEGKTIKRFEPDADNSWRFWFTDGTSFEIQSEVVGSYSLAVMEICEVCVND